MAFFNAQDVAIKGVSACVPETRYDNSSYSRLSKTKQKSFIETTGIAYRHVSTPGTTAADLCAEAAEQLIVSLGWNKQDIGLLVFVTCSGDYQAPATASILQHKLGLPHSCMCFDINMACSGFVYGLSVASRLVSSHIPKALLLVGDVGSVYTSYRDKSTFPLFGDAGTATALEHVAGAPPMYFDMHTDGSGFEALYVPDGGSRSPFSKDTLRYKKYGEGIYRNRNQIFLDGVAILKFSLREIPPHIKTFFKNINKTPDDIDFFVFHQANKLINTGIGKMLGIPSAKQPETLSKYGNTISASIPLTIADALSKTAPLSSAKLLMCGFGAGLSWGSAYAELHNTLCLPVAIKKQNIV